MDYIIIQPKSVSISILSILDINPNYHLLIYTNIFLYNRNKNEEVYESLIICERSCIPTIHVFY